MIRVLVVNDDPDLVMMCQIVLESAQFQVETSVEGHDVIPIVERFAPDVIVLDWVLDGLTGGDVLTRLDALLPRRPPVLVISALDRVATLSRVLGAEGFLRKPFTADELIDAVRRALAIGSARDLV
jgi:twitching motility two-component system response regulator PilH